MREEYCYDAFYEAMKRRDEGFVIYTNDTVEFFERMEQATDIYTFSTDTIGYGWVEEEVREYFPEMIEALKN